MNVMIVGIAGPSGSGKSTLARQAVRQLPHAAVVKQDKFFKDSNTFPIIGAWRNWEVPQNIEWEEFGEALRLLKAGNRAWIPEYSKPEGRQVGLRLVEPAPIVLVEGFLLFYEPRIRNLFDLKVYIQIGIDAQLGRRLSREPEFNADYFHQVLVPNYANFGAEAEKYADQVIDGEQDPLAVLASFQNILGRLSKRS
jgi:uridine kinase